MPSAEITIQSLPLPTLMLDADLRILAANDPALAILSLTANSAPSRPLVELFDIAEIAIEPTAESPAHLRSIPTRTHPPTPFDIAIARLEDNSLLAIFLDASPRTTLEAEVRKLHDQIAELRKSTSRLTEVSSALTSAEPPSIVGSSAPFLHMLDQVARVAPTEATVLIQGETGSGKELVARAVHAASPRARRAIIAVNCASLPESLIESELFGHERGAFTGADQRRLGKFELADNSTVFLDEIAELSPQAQAKLLRVLQEGTIQRVGGTEDIAVDVRVIAATHRDLAQRVQKRLFREDLFYRLNVFRIDVPALRDRREDIRPLVEYLHEKHARRMAKPVLPIADRSMRRLLAYQWPGNVRELENTVERATLLSPGPELEIEILPSPATTSAANRSQTSVPRDVLLDLTLDQLQRLQIVHALETSTYKVFGPSAAAAKLDINPRTLLSRMDKLGIPRPRELKASQRPPRPSD